MLHVGQLWHCLCACVDSLIKQQCVRAGSVLRYAYTIQLHTRDCKKSRTRTNARRVLLRETEETQEKQLHRRHRWYTSLRSRGQEHDRRYCNAEQLREAINA